MEQKERINILEKNLSRQLDWISKADSKVPFIFALNTAMLGVVAALLPNTAFGWDIAAGYFIFFTLFLCFISLLLLALSSFPRTDGPIGSLIYFGGIIAKEIEPFTNAVESLTTSEYMEDLIKQAYRNAQIANKKYFWIQRSLFCLFLSVLPWLMAVYLLYSS